MLETGWQDDAACRGEDTSLFYLKADDYQEEIAALREVCLNECPVLNECRAHALTWESFGFWGGMTVSERRRVRREQGIAKRSIRTAHMALIEGDRVEINPARTKAREGREGV